MTYAVPRSLEQRKEQTLALLAAPARPARPTRDVVMIDAELEQVYRPDDVPAELARRYAAQADWGCWPGTGDGAAARQIVSR